MDSKKKIDKQRTEEKGADSEKYGDGGEVGLTHYLGNNDFIPPEELELLKKEDKEVGKVARGNTGD